MKHDKENIIAIQNVMILVLSSNIGGVEKRFFNLAKYILTSNTKINFHITFIFSQNFLHKINFKVVQNHNISIISYGILNNKFIPFKIQNIINYLFLFVTLLRIKRKKHFDIVHLVTSASLKFRTLFNNSKIITSFYNGGSTLKGIYQKEYQKIFNENVHIDCLSSEIGRILIEIAGVNSKKVHVSPCSFIDVDSLPYKPHEKKPIICFAGRLNEQKGIQLLIPILKQITEINQEIIVKILGSGPLKQKIQEEIEKNNLEKKVILTFNVDPKIHFADSMIFLSLQQNENYPSQSLLEAMWSKNAIIATNVGLTKKLVSHENGILINETSEDLINAIKKLINNPSLTIQMGKKSRIKILNEHTVERFFNYLSSLYQNLNSE